MWLEELKTTDFNKDKKYTYVVSLGSTEQHGPFLPLGTDTYIHNEIIARVEKVFPSLIFLPTLPISCSKEHIGFPGTVWVEETTLFSVLRDVCSSLKENADKILFVSWHGGNVAPLNKFVAEVQGEYPSIEFYNIRTENEMSTSSEEKIIGGTVDEHAGNTEISMILAIKPKLVTIPSKNYPKKITKDVWSDSVIKSVENGIVDNHPNWVVKKSHGKAFLKLHTEVVIEEIKKVIS